MPEEDILERIDALALSIVENRQKSLFVLYYPDDSEIKVTDINDISMSFRAYLRNSTIGDTDILLHTMGGDPNAAYRIVQHIRTSTDKVSSLVPSYAYSAGTLMCFGTDKILLASSAVLSPIDISISKDNNNNRIELISIDRYIEFVRHCKKTIEDSGMKTDVEDALLVELVKQIGATDIGSFFRERELTKYYADILLSDYMLKDIPDRQKNIDHIIDMMVFKFPSHEFDIDYHIAKRIGLVVENMSIDLSDKTKSLIELLEGATLDGRICRYMGNGYRLPFFRLYNIREE